MKVCIVVPSYFPAIVYGGPIVSIHQCSKELSLMGIEVRVSTTNANGNSKLEVVPNVFHHLQKNYNVKYYDDTVIGRFSWRFVALVWEDIRRCDVVKIEDVFSTYIPPSLIYAKLFRKPVIISPRGALSAWALANRRHLLKKIWLRALVKPFLRNSWWHATSIQERDEIKACYPSARVVVIPNGIDLEEFSKSEPIGRREYLKRFANMDAECGPVIVSMGRLHRKKGFDVLIDAYDEIRRVYADALLLIAGNDDGERALLEQQVESLSLQGRVLFVGEISGLDKVEFLTGADVFVLPSHNENFGNVYLEAMACGVPVVASKATPWADVERFGCGKWVDNSVSETASAILELLARDRATMVASAKEFAARYSWPYAAKCFQETFSEMLTDRPLAKDIS